MVTEGSEASMEMVYAVRFGSVDLEGGTIRGRSRVCVRDGVMGAQMRPLFFLKRTSSQSLLYEAKEEERGNRYYLVHRTMNAIFSVVTSSAAIMRSPSFSRDGESRTMMNCPARKAAIVSSTLSKMGGLLRWVPFERAPLVIG